MPIQTDQLMLLNLPWADRKTVVQRMSFRAQAKLARTSKSGLELVEKHVLKGLTVVIDEPLEGVTLLYHRKNNEINVVIIIVGDANRALSFGLRTGDQLVLINEKEVKTMNKAQITDVLAAKDPKTMQICRRSRDYEEYLVKKELLFRKKESSIPIFVSLTRSSAQNMGLVLFRRTIDCRVYYFVAKLTSGSPAEKDGRLVEGDHIVTINGRHTETLDRDEIDDILEHKCRISITIYR